VIRFVLDVVGVLLLIAGTIFALQGFGVLGGSVMSGSSFWAAAGPIIAVVGLALLVGSALRGRRRSSAGR
jgi:MYXO-CTERM domain-containing protein